MVLQAVAYPTVALVETKHTKGICGCIYQTTKTLAVNKPKNTLPDAWVLHGSARHQLQYAVETVIEYKEHTCTTNQLRDCNGSSVKERQRPCSTV